MLRITVSKSANGAVKYFDEGLSKSDYYAEKGEIIGKWHGKTAKLIGLEGEVKREEFTNLAYNKNPITGEQLTARNSENRRVGYDFTFDVPKSVSLIYSQTKDKDILTAFNKSVNDTMLEIEENAATRVRINGKNENRFTKNMVWGTFTHEEARPVGGIPDPHLHQHVFVFNATFDEKEKRFKAAQFGDIKRDAPYFEAVFHSRFADNLQKAGYDIERDKHNFQVKGFERSTIEKFSNRTREINEKAEKLGLTYVEDKSKLGAKTREAKRTGYDKEDIRLQWRSRLSERELDLINNAKSEPPSSGGNSGLLSFASEKKKDKINAKETLNYAFSHALERKSVVREKELMTIGLKRGIGSVIPEDLRAEIRIRKDILKKDLPKSKDALYTTKEAIEEESILRDFARAGKGKYSAINSDYQIKNRQLTNEQANAVKHVLSSKDFITIVTGDAGTGKTWSIKEVAEGVKQTGKSFSAFAPSSAASREVQREEGFGEATTIAELLQNKKYHNQIREGVIWIDEAGMVGNKTMNKVINLAKEQNARLLLTGDVKQHGAVERGDVLRIIQEYGGVKSAKISKIQRQKNEDYRSAIKSISNGDLSKGIETLNKMGAITQAEDFIGAKNNVANEYVKSVKQKENALIVATTHAQGKAVTETIRGKLKEHGILKGKERIYKTQQNLSYTDAEKEDTANYQEGMIIQFHQNVKGGIKRGTKYQVLGQGENGEIRMASEKKKDNLILPVAEAAKFSVYNQEQIALAKGDKIRITQNGMSKAKKRLNNGNILTIDGFDKDGNIKANSGKSSHILDKNYGNFTHGYYTTSPASQGKSVNRVIVLQSSLSGKAASKEQFYVSASRGKFAISIHTDDKEHLLQSVEWSSHRMTATELAENAKSKPDYLKERLKRIGKIYQTIKSRVASFAKERDNPIINFRPQPQKNIAYATPGKSK